MKVYLLLITTIALTLISCKHDHPPASEELIKAFEIQKEGLKAISQIEVKIKAADIADVRTQQLRLEQYKKNMIEIEGMQHDHSQCNGDHSKKRFSIPDNEMLAVQKEWRDSLLSILSELP